MKQRKLWGFLKRVSAVNVPQYSLPELAELIGMPPRKVGSLKAILAKPEQRLGVQFLELVPNSSPDVAGNTPLSDAGGCEESDSSSITRRLTDNWHPA